MRSLTGDEYLDEFVAPFDAAWAIAKYFDGRGPDLIRIDTKSRLTVPGCLVKFNDAPTVELVEDDKNQIIVKSKRYARVFGIIVRFDRREGFTVVVPLANRVQIYFIHGDYFKALGKVQMIRERD